MRGQKKPRLTLKSRFLNYLIKIPMERAIKHRCFLWIKSFKALIILSFKEGIMNDTVKLLRECDAGIEMGVATINEVLDDVENDELKNFLCEAKKKHLEMGESLKRELDKYADEGKSPNPMAKGMSYLKTNMKMAFEPSDQTIAELVTDGCNMGVKSLNKYLNQFTEASEKSKEITKALIDVEEKLAIDIRRFL